MRDDISSLPLPTIAKQYARRKGLRSMMRQPKDFERVNAVLSNPGKVDKFKSYDAVGKVKNTFSSESMKQAEALVDALIGGTSIHEQDGLTVAKAMADCREYGCSLRRDSSGEFVVRQRATGAMYHTNDLTDAVKTAKAMHQRHNEEKSNN